MEFFDTPLARWPAVDLRRLVALRGAADPALPAEAFVAYGAATDRLGELLSGGALCVTTGQQPGLLLGPLYTIYKALTAAAAAARFQAILERPVVPVFWVAGDDHDFAEANHLTVLDNEGELRKLELRGRPEGTPSTPMYREILGSDIEAVFTALRETLPPTEFLETALRDLSATYDPASDLATSFGAALARLVGDFGVVVFNPTAPAAKRVQAPHLLKALELAPELDRELAVAGELLERTGGRVPVRVGDGASLVMIEAAQGRDRLIIREDGFATRRSGEAFTLDALRQVAADEPGRLSANVLLRPVVEAAILPTLAYVGGPGELAYFAQCDPVYDLLGVAPQVKVSRWSAVAVESRVKKTLHKYAIGLEDLRGTPGELETRLVGEDLPAEVTRLLEEIRGALTRGYEGLGAAAVTIDPTLRKPVESARNQSLAAARDIEKKIVSHLKQKNEIMVRQIGRARAETFPGGVSQERVLNIIPFLARYGDEFLSVAYEACSAYVALETMDFSG